MAKSGKSNLDAIEPAVRIQYAALPYRRDARGFVEIMLITSRDTGRWIVPKGWPMKGRTPAKTAAREAFEEAGLRGEISLKSIGTFRYEKFLDETGRTVPCAVQVFPLLVKRQLVDWPEHDQRRTEWFAPADAAARVGEPELAALIRSFAERASGDLDRQRQ